MRIPRAEEVFEVCFYQRRKGGEEKEGKDFLLRSNEAAIAVKAA